MLQAFAGQLAPLVRRAAVRRPWLPISSNSVIPAMRTFLLPAAGSNKDTSSPNVPRPNYNPATSTPHHTNTDAASVGKDDSIQSSQEDLVHPAFVLGRTVPTPAPAPWGEIFTAVQQTESEPPISAEKQWANNSESSLYNLARQQPMNPYSGRSVPVHRDVSDALRKLDMILNRNKVRLTWRQQQRHEKKGVKRRRLSSERWRKQFANEVRKKVQIVQAIRHRGA